jgi:hypothetical protein
MFAGLKVNGGLCLATAMGLKRDESGDWLLWEARLS